VQVQYGGPLHLTPDYKTLTTDIVRSLSQVPRHLPNMLKAFAIAPLDASADTSAYKPLLSAAYQRRPAEELEELMDAHGQ
jgi:capsule polysaccharide modification protein KpsS